MNSLWIKPSYVESVIIIEMRFWLHDFMRNHRFIQSHVEEICIIY